MTAPAQPSPRDRFLALVRAAFDGGTLVKLTLGKHRGADATLQNVHIRPVALQAGAHFAFVWRHATRDITKNHPPAVAIAEIERLIGGDFSDAHLFTTTQRAQLELRPDGGGRIRVLAAVAGAGAPPAGAVAHDRTKRHFIPATAPWLRALGVTNERGLPREGMADKFRQIQKFAELLTHLMEEAFPGARPSASGPQLQIADMGSGKGYLTFALAQILGDRAHVRGIEARAELVEVCNRVARESGLTHLAFAAGRIESAPAGAALDVLIALHACDTATDDALAHGVAAGAPLLVVAPCCQKELRAQLTAPPVLAEPLRHGIFQERHAEFATDALRALLLEWAGYRTKVFEFISTEHTAKNLMIAAIKVRERAAPDGELAARAREFAAFYGIRTQALARALGFSFSA
ncbi:MAG: SAM-dependent methyltransferase [Opitutaceae bacterium]|nr:SAM-dependent methyltransferase [Opitutaceae bacterium]